MKKTFDIEYLKKILQKDEIEELDIPAIIRKKQKIKVEKKLLNKK